METDVRGSQITGLFRTGQPSPFFGFELQHDYSTTIIYSLTVYSHYNTLQTFAIYW